MGRTLIHKSLHDQPANYGPDFGGFINVAGPLGGAAILNNRDMILDMASHACGKFLKAELADRKVVNWIFKKLVGDDFIASGCESMGESILPLFFQKYFDPITEHYKVGAPFLDSLKKDANHEAYRDLPKITFYCVEPRDRIFWRTLSWMAKDPNGPGFFEANHDFGFYEENMAGMYLRYQASLQESLDRINYLHDTQSGWGWILGLNIALMLNVKRHAEKADAMRDIVEWFDGVHSEWEAVIGTSEYVWVLDTCYICTDCTSGKRRYCKEEGCCAELGCARSAHSVLAGYRTRIYENDGVVTAPSASDLPYQTWKPVRVYPNEHVNTLHKGSSHMQVRN
ncbi:MAG: hypothetical protein LBV02_00955, partial [Bacteroidales bacterium]|nr:hypothetical protein [Bacteroidales bacterium]